jgi:2-(3-amino-3-carboxypropyl)histidine synthase
MMTERPSGAVALGAVSRVFATIGPDLVEAIRQAKPRRVVLQVPAGLIRNAHDLAARLRDSSGVPFDLTTRPCFGACDFPSHDEAPRADLAVVLGHAPIPNVPLVRTTFFVEMRASGGDPDALADIVVKAKLPSRLGMVASVQHMDLVEPLRSGLEKRGFQVHIGEGDRRLAYAAQALGCNYTGAEAVVGSVDAFLFLGTGRFHPIGLAFAVDRPVYALDPLRGELEAPIDRGALIRKRQLVVAVTSKGAPSTPTSTPLAPGSRWMTGATIRSRF